MPDQNVAERYAEWLATPPADGVAIDALCFEHPSLAEPFYVCNRADGDISLGLETGATVKHLAMAFSLSLIDSKTTTQEEIAITASALDGQMLAAFDALEAGDLMEPLIVTWRFYIWPTDLTYPAITPPPRLTVETMELGLTSINIRAVGPRWPNKAAGTRYIIEQFPGLRGFV